MSDTLRKPHPRDSVLNISTSVYWRLLKHWFWQCSPAGHTWGWHSYISMRLIHSESMPHGLSSVALQLQRGISDRSAVIICTFPIGRFTWKSMDVGRWQHEIKEPTTVQTKHKQATPSYLNVFVRRRLFVVLSVFLELSHLLFCQEFPESISCFI